MVTLSPLLPDLERYPLDILNLTILPLSWDPVIEPVHARPLARIEMKFLELAIFYLGFSLPAIPSPVSGQDSDFFSVIIALPRSLSVTS